MAKAQTPKFVIEDYVAPVSQSGPNPYEEHVDALIEAGEGKTLAITVPTEQVAGNVRLFQKAANAKDRTARKVSTTEDGDNTVVRFRLKAREIRPGRAGHPKPDESATVEGEATE